LARVGGEDLVLAEHPARQVGQHGTGLYPGQPAANGGGDRARLLTRGQPLGERGDDLTQARDVGGGPVLPIHHPHTRIGHPRLHLGVGEDVFGRLLGEPAQVGDDLSRLGVRSVRPRAAQGGRGSCGKVPVDELRHAPTVPAPIPGVRFVPRLST
jgi:hypothetical protein